MLVIYVESSSREWYSLKYLAINVALKKKRTYQKSTKFISTYNWKGTQIVL